MAPAAKEEMKNYNAKKSEELNAIKEKLDTVCDKLGDIRRTTTYMLNEDIQDYGLIQARGEHIRETSTEMIELITGEERLTDDHESEDDGEEDELVE